MSKNTTDLVNRLKQSATDFEFYPTSQRMINLILQWIPNDASSIMDIGCGDGRVLKIFAEKCEHVKLYGIEKSEILTQAWHESIIPIGTEFWEQNLSQLMVDYIFCNPPYSEFEDWVCKIISEGYAKKAFLIIPQRWKESDAIKETLAKRGATTFHIGSDDFLDGDRKARAIVDIIEIRYPKTNSGRDGLIDPFNIWFDANIETFDKVDEFKESTTSEFLARKLSDASIDEIVECYQDEYNRMQDNYRAIFLLDYSILKELGIDKAHVRDGLKLKMAGLKNKYWKLLFDRLDAITSRLTTASRKKLLDRLTGNMAVGFTVNNCYSVVLWALKNANQYFDSQLIDLFKELATFEGIKNYKSNLKTWDQDNWRYSRWDFQKQHTHYSLDYRIVLQAGTTFCSADYMKYDYPGGLYKDRHNTIADIIAVFSNLGFTTNSQSSIQRSWQSGKWQDWYRADGEILFQTKAFQNGNMHFRFNQSAIKALNIEAGRLLKWVRTKEDVVDEMVMEDTPYTMEDAGKYFKSNRYLMSSNVKLLEAPKE